MAVEKSTLSQPAASPVNPHPNNKTDVHEQFTDIIYTGYTNPIKTRDRMRKQCIPGPLPSFGRGPGYETSH